MSKVPPFFYVAFPLSKALPTLGKGYLQGIAGVLTSIGKLKKSFAGHDNRNVMLKMPGDAFLQQNGVQQVRYTDPETLVADNLAVLSRILEGNRTSAIQTVLSSAIWDLIKDITPHLKNRAIIRFYQTLREVGGNRLYKILKSARIPPIKNMASLEKYYGTVLQRMAKSKEQLEGFFQIPKSLIQKSLIQGVLSNSKGFQKEKEWLIPTKKLTIPEGSKLFFFVYDLPAHFEQGYTKEGVAYLKSLGLKGHALSRVQQLIQWNIEQTRLLKDSGITRRYKTVRTKLKVRI